MSESQEDAFVASCPHCRARMRLPAKAVGRRIKCPKCAEHFTGPQPRPTPPVPVAPRDEDESDSLLDELAGGERSAVAVESPQTSAPQAPCPSCRALLPPGARVCVACGYDLETGRRHKVARTQPSKVAQVAKSAGTFALGGVLSSVGALVGAAIWSVVATVTGYEIGWIAWGVGALAGSGMLLGYRKQNTKAGLVAATTAALGVLGGKVFIFGFVIYAVISGNTRDIDLQREHVKLRLTDTNLDQREAWSDSEREKQWDSAYAEAEKRLSAMTDDKVRQTAEAYEREDADEKGTADRASRRRLASHHADRRAEEAGLAYGDPQRETFFSEEMKKYAGLPQAELDAALAALKAWDEGGKWSDENYVRCFLIYEAVDRAMMQKPGGNNADDEDEDAPIPPDKWKQWYAAAVAEVDPIPPAQRLEQAKRVESEREQRRQELMAKFAERSRSAESENDSGAAGAALGAFFSAMFGPLDILFMLLAVGTAFKIARGSADD